MLANDRALFDEVIEQFMKVPSCRTQALRTSAPCCQVASLFRNQKMELAGTHVTATDSSPNTRTARRPRVHSVHDMNALLNSNVPTELTANDRSMSRSVSPRTPRCAHDLQIQPAATGLPDLAPTKQRPKMFDAHSSQPLCPEERCVLLLYACYLC